MYQKALYIIAAISLAATSAMASKARQAALSNTTAITDIQSIFLNPADMHYVGDFATFEMGDSTIGGAPDAEGGFLHTMGDAKLGFYLGKTSTNVTGLRSLANTDTGVTYLSHENPFEVFFSERGFKIGNTRLSFETIEDALSKNFSITLENGNGLVLDAVRMQKILRYKNRT